MVSTERAEHDTCSKNTGLFGCVLAISCILLLPRQTQANGVPFQTGDVFAAVGGHQVRHFNSKGVLLDTLIHTGSGIFNTGMAFDAAGNLYVTGFDSNSVFKFSNQGVFVGTFGSGYNANPESIVFDRNGNAYVGQPDGTRRILKFDRTGVLLASYGTQTEDRGTDWLDLTADQCTLHYTSEGDSIFQFNVCTNTQMPAFATGLQGPCYAHRIRPNFEEMVACSSVVYRLNSNGAIMQRYALSGSLFALNLDPDNKTFWTADFSTGQIFHVDIATGIVVLSVNAGATVFLGGLAVVGEITASTPPNVAPPSTTSYYVRTRDSRVMGAMGADLAQRQIASGISQDSVVALLFGDATAITDASHQQLFGVSGYSRKQPLMLADIAALVQGFVIGYYNALGNNNTLHVRIAIGTNNHPARAAFGGNQVNPAHGRAWAGMVNSVASWVVTNGYAGQVDIAGAFDAEPGYSTPAVTRSWVDGYASVAQRFLYDVGDSGGKGCPQVACENQWTTEDLWYVSWGATPALPLPEIYRTNGTMAAQWQFLSLYGAQVHGQNLIVSGALTTFGTCDTDPKCSRSIDNSPSQGWQQLNDVLNADARTAQTLPWSTDLSWSRP